MSVSANEKETALRQNQLMMLRVRANHYPNRELEFSLTETISEFTF